MKSRVPAAVIGFLAGAAILAHASSTLTVNYGATTSSQPGVTYLIYSDVTDTITDPNSLTTVSGDFSNDWDQGSYPGNGAWVGLQNGDFTTFTFSEPMDYVGLNWGTPDPYNLVVLFDGATQIGSYTGSDFVDGAGYANFTPGAGEEITSLTLSSSQCCFETNGFSYVVGSASPVPEPSTLPLLSSGLIVVAIFLRRRLCSSAV